MGEAMMVVIGGFFAIVGLAALLNLGGAADRLGDYNARQSDTPRRTWERENRPDRIYPESRTGMRLWGVVALFCGLVCVWAALTW